MKGFLLHTAADTTNLGVVGPIFSDGTFEFIPIDNVYGFELRTYADVSARNTKYGKTLADFIPSYVANRPVHYDPDFDNYTYGQPVGRYPRSRVLEKLKEGNVVFFVSSLAPYDSQVYKERDTSLVNFQRGRKNKYVIGFLTVKGVVRVFVFKSNPRLTLALLDVAFLEGGEVTLTELEKELNELEQYGYITKEGKGYRLTPQRNMSSRSGENITDAICSLWPAKKSAQRQLLEDGLFEVTLLSGNTTEEIIKTSHHYKRLRSLDWDHFRLIVGDPKHSALLTNAIRLTKRYERFSFMLNELGQSILKRHSDTLRGFRWIDEEAVRLLASEISKVNIGLSNKLQYLF